MAAWESSRENPEPIPYRIPDLLARLDAEHRQTAQDMLDAGTPVYVRPGDGFGDK